MRSQGRSFSIDCVPTKTPNPEKVKPRAKSLVSASMRTHTEQGGSCSSTPTKTNERRSSIEENIEITKRENLLKAHSDGSTVTSSISPSSPSLRGYDLMRRSMRRGSIGCVGGQICNLLNLPQQVRKWKFN